MQQEPDDHVYDTMDIDFVGKRHFRFQGKWNFHCSGTNSNVYYIDFFGSDTDRFLEKKEAENKSCRSFKLKYKYIFDNIWILLIDNFILLNFYLF